MRKWCPYPPMCIFLHISFCGDVPVQAAVVPIFREGGSDTIFREVKYKFIFVGKTCPGGIFNAAVPVCFHLILAAQILVNVPLGFVEHLYED